MSSTIRWVIVALSVLGLGFAGASTWVHYRLLTDPSYVSPCDVSATFNCSQVYLSQYGSIAGVPVAIGGLIWFGLTALIAAFAKPGTGESPAAGYLLALSIVGLATSLYLGYVSYAVLATGCLLCIGTYVSVVGIFVAALMSRPMALAKLPARAAADVSAAIAQPVVLVATLAYLTVSLGAAAVFPGEGGPSTAPAAPTASQQLDFAAAWAQQPRIDLGIDAEGAAVVVVKYNDFECPACRQAEMFYKPVFDRLAASHPGAVKYVVKDWPLDASCNFHMMSTVPRHEAACDAAAAARMAADRGRYQEMVDWIYANQGVSKAELRAAAQRILGVTDFDREYALKLPDIRRDIADGGALNIQSTPTYFINGVRLGGGLTPQQFEMAITLEIQAAAGRLSAEEPAAGS